MQTTDHVVSNFASHPSKAARLTLSGSISLVLSSPCTLVVVSFDRCYVEFRRPPVLKCVNLISPRNQCHAAVTWHIWCFPKYLNGCTICVQFIIIYQHRIIGDESITASCLHHRNAVENICLANIHRCLFKSMIIIIMNTGKRGCHYQYTGGRIRKVNLPWYDTMQQCKSAKSKWL